MVLGYWSIKKIHYTIKSGSFNGEDFEFFLIELNELLQTESPGSYADISDNARIHHKLSLPCEMPLIYLPPYSQFLNPIESVFNVYKSIIKKELDYINKFPSQVDRKAKLQESTCTFITNTPEFGFFYSRCTIFLTKCLLKEDIIGD